MFEVDFKYIDELYKLKTSNFEKVYESVDYHKLHDIFDSMYNIRDWDFSFDMSCTDLINSLFEKYVTPSTLIIASLRDHPSVREALNNCSQEMVMDYDQETTVGGVIFLDDSWFNIRVLIDRLENLKYDNILFISYGTLVCNGEVRDNKYFQRLFQLCDKYCDNVIKVLDDCQGSLWIERDYSLFDYVLWTAHATIDSFDTGILLSAPNMPALGAHDVGEEFLYANYKRLLENECFCKSWNKYLSLATNFHLSQAPHIFSVPLTKDYPESYFSDLHKGKKRGMTKAPLKIDANRFIRLRVERFLTYESKYLLLRGLRDIYYEREFVAV